MATYGHTHMATERSHDTIRCILSLVLYSECFCEQTFHSTACAYGLVAGKNKRRKGFCMGACTHLQGQYKVRCRGFAVRVHS